MPGLRGAARTKGLARPQLPGTRIQSGRPRKISPAVSFRATGARGADRPRSALFLWYSSHTVMRRALYNLAQRLALLGCVAQTVPAAGAIQLPDLGEESASVISPAQERKLGENFMHQARGVLAFVDDPELNAYIKSLGAKLVAGSDNPELDFRFFLISDPSVNAFAVPGGFIGVHTGLILTTQSEAELASVLAHEIAHITQRHIPRMISDAQRTSLPAMAALLASILLAASGSSGGNAAIALTSATLTQRGINFTRAFEEEADRIGMNVLVRAGFDPRAMPAFFARMQTFNRYNETDLPEFLRTHPVTTNRIADSRARAEQYDYHQRPDTADYLHARAKLQALTPGDAGEVARGFKHNLEQGKYRDADAERYGYALALLRDRQLDAALIEAKRLIERDPRNVWYRVLEADIAMAAQRYPQALEAYEAAHKRHPDNTSLTRFYAAALLKTERADIAKGLIKTALQREPDDAGLYKMLAQAAGATGEPIEAHRAMAEHYYLSGKPKAAIEQLQIAARKADNNFYLQASLEARIQAIREELALYDPK